MTYPQPPSHKTFTFGNIIIDSNFDSANCANVQRVSNTNYNLWIGTDHPKNNYRTWFYFSVEGFLKGATVTFKIKNMQNQSRLLNQGLVPVYRQASSDEWKRIKERINTSNIEYNEGWIQWPFRHTWTSNEKVYFAFFYPWSNEDNDKFLNQISEKVKNDTSIYFHRTSIINSLEGRPVQFLTISSVKGFVKKQEPINDENLFKNGKRPMSYNGSKKFIVLGARVHPGQVPASHVMTGIIEELTESNRKAELLRDNFVFYIFPIFNPDGVGRGHYRVDTNGINLNRCYLKPTTKNHPSIYAVKKIIMYLHEQDKFFGFLDLHAHAARKGTFIYGNYSNQLAKQVGVCLFPKILSMNSIDFEYQGSNFTEKNMYCKDRADHVSKQGSGRVAIFKATKNPYCWTLQCNYNISKVNNVLEKPKSQQEQVKRGSQKELDKKIIVDYKYPQQKEAKNFFTIETYRKLGSEICESFLDLIEKNPHSRIQNPSNHFKSVQNLKMNLAVSLLRMDSSRFETQFKKIYNAINAQDSSQIYERALKALYFILIKNARIQNINGYLKDNDTSSITYISPVKPKSLPNRPRNLKINTLRENNNSVKMRKKETTSNSSSPTKTYEQSSPLINFNSGISLQAINNKSSETSKSEIFEEMLLDKLKIYEREKTRNKITLKVEEFRLSDLSALSKMPVRDPRRSPNKQRMRLQVQELPKLNKRISVNFDHFEPEPELVRKGFSATNQSQTKR